MPAKVLLWDLETTNLGADFGFLICAGYKWLGDRRTHIISITDSPNFRKDVTNDKYVVETFREVLEEADVWVTHYGKRFDQPYVNSKLVLHGLPVLPNTPHIDTWEIAKKRLRLHSNRLASVSAFLGLEEKTPVKGPQWIRAMSGNREAIKYVIDHCRQDVLVLEQAYERIKPLAINHPNVALLLGNYGGCPTCGASALRSNGMRVAEKKVYRRLQCRKCGAWTKGAAV